MKRMIGYGITAGALATAGWRMGWYADPPLLGIAAVLLVMVLGVCALVQRWRRAGVAARPTNSLAPGFARVVAKGLLVGLFFSAVLGGGVKVVDWVLVDVVHIRHRVKPEFWQAVGEHERAGNYEYAIQLIQARLQRPLSASDRHVLLRRLCVDLVKAGKTCEARGDIAGAQRFFQKSLSLARAHGLDSELAQAYEKDVAVRRDFLRRIEELRRECKWAEVVVAVQEEIQRSGDAPDLGRYLVEALTELGSKGTTALAQRAEFLGKAVATAGSHRLEARDAARQLADVEAELQRRQHVLSRLEQLPLPMQSILP